MLFKDVLVDEELKRQLVALADENRISHAQLFLGRNGSHSFALALAFAQYICCTDRHDGDSCGQCHSCKMFEKLQHPDLHLIFPNCTFAEVDKDPDSEKLAGHFRDFVFANDYHLDYNEWVKHLKSERKQVVINIRDTANILMQNSIRSYENGYKIYILWMADKIQLAAANKLLKTLEEPESQSLFILIAESSDQMLPTILSRTQLVKIPPLSEAMIRQQLVEREGVTEQEAADLAAVSDGSYVRALNLLHDSAEMHHLLTNYNIIMKSIAAYLQNPKDLARINYLQVQDVLAELGHAGREMQKRFLNYMLRMFRNSLLLNTGNNSLVRATSEEWKVLDEFQMLFTLKDSSQLLQECSDALYHLERNANVNILLTDFYFKLLKAFSQR